MKHTAILFLIALFSVSMTAQDVTTVQATGTDISDNLDLEAVASIFADAKDLEDFERKLNDPELRISNLDLNADGYVDYLRIVELSGDNTRVITIQAVIGKDLYQDVATIDVERDERGQTRVQVVGDVYMYGENYIIEPVYRYRPVIYTYLWTPRFQPWCSSYYWGYYPSYWSFWSPFSFGIYWGHVSAYHHHHQFYYRPYRYSNACANLYVGHRQNAYGYAHPRQAFSTRNAGYTNKREYDAKTKPMDRITKSASAGLTADNRPASARPSDSKGGTKPVSGLTATKGNTGATNNVGRPVEKGTAVQSDRPVASKPSYPTNRPIAESGNANSARPSADARPMTSTTKPSTDSRPQTSTTRPSTNSRPQTSTTRPSENPRNETSTRPSSEARPQSDSRPQSTRPSSDSRPAQTSTRPSSESRPQQSARPSKPSSQPKASPSKPSQRRSSGNVNRGSSSPSRSSGRVGGGSSSRPSAPSTGRSSGGSSSKSSSGSKGRR